MRKLRVDGVGSVGLVKDTAPWKVPAGAWSGVLNADFENTSVQLPVDFRLDRVSLSSPLRAVFSYVFGGSEFLILCSAAEIWAEAEGGLYDITPAGASLSFDPNLNWQHLIFNGYLMLNNGIDEPYYWPLVQGGIDLGQRLMPLSEYPGSEWPAGQSCMSLVAYSNALFAANIKTDGVHYPYLVKFSDFAEPGLLPVEWTARSTNNAGDFLLPESLDEITALQVLKNNLFIFKERSIHALRYVGGNSVYQQLKISDVAGPLSRRSVDVSDEFMVFISKDDVMYGSGGELLSVAEGSVRRHLFEQMDSATYKETFVQVDAANKLFWIVIPTIKGSGTKAFIWNFRDKSWSERDLPGYLSGVNAFRSLKGPETWEALGQTWENWRSPWVVPFLGEAAEKILFAKSLEDSSGNCHCAVAVSLSKIEQVEDTRLPAILERVHIPFPQGEVMDWDTVKFVTSVWPKFSLDTGDYSAWSEDKPVRVWLAGQMEQDEPLEWKELRPWVPGSRKKKIGCRVSGRFISIKFEIPPEAPWKLTGYDLEFTLQSRR